MDIWTWTQRLVVVGAFAVKDKNKTGHATKRGKVCICVCVFVYFLYMYVYVLSVDERMVSGHNNRRACAGEWTKYLPNWG